MVAPRRGIAVAALLVAALLLAGCATTPVTDPLPSWNEGATKAAIVKLVDDTTRAGSPDFVPPAERIATFDNDGTLWTEHPMYVEVLFTLDRIRALAAQQSVVAHRDAVQGGDRQRPRGDGEAHGGRLLQADRGHARGLHVGASSGRRRPTGSPVTKHPRFNRLYTELVYQPMLEVLAYFRANGYKTFIVSGGTLDFMRAFAEKAYGIPPEQVVGTSFDARYTFADDVALTKAEPRLMLLDDGPGKAVGIDHYIGRVPIAAFGNSDGDLAMLETTTNSPQSRGRRGSRRSSGTRTPCASTRTTATRTSAG